MSEDNKEEKVIYVRQLPAYDEDEVEIDLLRVLKIFWERKKVTFSLMAVGVIAALGVSLVMPKTYTSTALISIAKWDQSNPSAALTAALTQDLPTGVTATAVKNLPQLTVSATSSDAEKAEALAQEGIEAIFANNASFIDERDAMLESHAEVRLKEAREKSAATAKALYDFSVAHNIKLPASLTETESGMTTQLAQSFEMQVLIDSGVSAATAHEFIDLQNSAAAARESYMAVERECESRRTQTAMNEAELHVLKDPSAATSSASKLPRNAGLGFAAGLLLALLYSFYRYWPEMKAAKEQKNHRP